MSASSSTSYMHAAVAFNKVPGTLSLHSDQTVRWVPSSASSGVSSFSVKFAHIAGLQTSKPGSATIALMLVLSNGVQIAAKPKALLVFNAAQQTALDDRENFKNELAAAVTKNRVNADGSPSASASATPFPSVPASPAPAAASSPASSTRAATPDTRSATPTASSSPLKRPRPKDLPAPKTDLELRISVIKSNAQLRALHKDIVISGQMSDAEFWSHPSRQRLLRSERAKLEQRAGRNARLADPKPTPNEAGELKLSITPELIRDLFEQFPVVARAYEDNVPAKMDEGTFWTRYFQSKLYHRLRTSARSAASGHIVQDDAVFDQYLEEEDNGLEPRRRFNPHHRLLDLEATEEDHGETGNEKDWTMRAGAERRTLPLMRRFNDHSQSLLDSALGDQEEEERRRRKRRRVVGGVGEEYAPGTGIPESGNPPKVGGGNADDEGEAADSVDWIKNHYYKEIVIDELEASAKTDKMRLNMANLEGYLTGSSSSDSVDGPGSRSQASTKPLSSFELVPSTMAEYLDYVSRFNTTVERKAISLGTFKPNALGTEAAMVRMVGNLRSRTHHPRAGEAQSLPDGVHKSISSLHASTTEFVRQFWNAIAPAPAFDDDVHDNAQSSDADSAKAVAAKMATNLARFDDKLEALLNTATTGLDEVLEEKVNALLGPTGKAVQRALAIARSKGLIA